MSDRLNELIKDAQKIHASLETVNAAAIASTGPNVELNHAIVSMWARDTELEQQLLIGFSGTFVVVLEEFATKKATVLKNSRARYEHAMGDFDVSARKASVRLGKSAETMDIKKYMEAAVEREIALVNYNRVTTQHLEEHALVEDSKNLELMQELMRAYNAQLQYMTALVEAAETVVEVAEQASQWAEQECARITAATAESEQGGGNADLKQLVEHHESFVRALGGANLAVVHALFKSNEAAVRGSVESVLAEAFDAWGISEQLLGELVARHPSDDSLPIFSGNKTCERLLCGYIQAQFGRWYEACFASLVLTVFRDPQAYVCSRAEGVSALLTLIEQAIDAVERSGAATFPPLFALLCKGMTRGSQASLIGGRVMRFLMSHTDLFGGPRCTDPARTTLEVTAFVVWQCLMGRPFTSMDAGKASHLKVSISVTHAITEHVDMLNGWLKTSDAARLSDLVARLADKAGPVPAASFAERLEAVSEGGCVAVLLQQVRSRLDQIGETLAATDRNAAFRLSDTVARASVAVAVMDPAARAASMMGSGIGHNSGIDYSTSIDANEDGFEYQYVYAEEGADLSALQATTATAATSVASKTPEAKNGPPPRPALKRDVSNNQMGAKPARPPPPSAAPAGVSPPVTPTLTRAAASAQVPPTHTPPLPPRSPRNLPKK